MPQTHFVTENTKKGELNTHAGAVETAMSGLRTVHDGMFTSTTVSFDPYAQYWTDYVQDAYTLAIQKQKGDRSAEANRLAETELFAFAAKNGCIEAVIRFAQLTPQKTQLSALSEIINFIIDKKKLLWSLDADSAFFNNAINKDTLKQKLLDLLDIVACYLGIGNNKQTYALFSQSNQTSKPNIAYKLLEHIVKLARITKISFTDSELSQFANLPPKTHEDTLKRISDLGSYTAAMNLGYFYSDTQQANASHYFCKAASLIITNPSYEQNHEALAQIEKHILELLNNKSATLPDLSLINYNLAIFYYFQLENNYSHSTEDLVAKLNSTIEKIDFQQLSASNKQHAADFLAKYSKTLTQPPKPNFAFAYSAALKSAPYSLEALQQLNNIYKSPQRPERKPLLDIVTCFEAFIQSTAPIKEKTMAYLELLNSGFSVDDNTLDPLTNILLKSMFTELSSISDNEKDAPEKASIEQDFAKIPTDRFSKISIENIMTLACLCYENKIDSSVTKAKLSDALNINFGFGTISRITIAKIICIYALEKNYEQAIEAMINAPTKTNDLITFAIDELFKQYRTTSSAEDKLKFHATMESVAKSNKVTTEATRQAKLYLYLITSDSQIKSKSLENYADEIATDASLFSATFKKLTGLEKLDKNTESDLITRRNKLMQLIQPQQNKSVLSTTTLATQTTTTQPSKPKEVVALPKKPMPAAHFSSTFFSSSSSSSSSSNDTTTTIQSSGQNSVTIPAALLESMMNRLGALESRMRELETQPSSSTPRPVI